VSACISSILKEAGYRVGLFTSPALEQFSERIQINGVPIPGEDLERLNGMIQAQAQQMNDPPTEFERATALALCWFAERGCDIAVMEVGLGGREDATNVIPTPEVAVLVSMGLDHTRLLGNTLTDIAQVKAGILKPGGAAVSYGNEPEAENVFCSVSEALSVDYQVMDQSRISQVITGLEGCHFQLAPYGEIHLPLIGTYQAGNALLAVTAVEAMSKRGWNVSAEAICHGLEQVRWPGRFELLCREPLFFLDGSHNPHGLNATVDSIQRVLGEKKPVVLLGVMADKDVTQMLRLLLPVAERFVTVTPDNPRAMPAETLAARIRDLGGIAESAETVREGVREAVRLAGLQGAVCALGTLYFSGAVRQAVKQLESAHQTE
jgi:dihydrofolate synthase/folylpolyglutamate synthase